MSREKADVLKPPCPKNTKRSTLEEFSTDGFSELFKQSNQKTDFISSCNKTSNPFNSWSITTKRRCPMLSSKWMRWRRSRSWEIGFIVICGLRTNPIPVSSKSLVVWKRCHGSTYTSKEVQLWNGVRWKNMDEDSRDWFSFPIFEPWNLIIETNPLKKIKNFLKKRCNISIKILLIHYYDVWFALAFKYRSFKKSSH